MSPSSAQQWTRRIRYADQHIRVSDAERNAVVELLGQHYAEGRLDQAEFDERVTRAMSAKTRGDLEGLFDDLPDLGHGIPFAGSPGTPAAHTGPGIPVRVRRGHGIIRPLLFVALVLIAANITWHALFFTSFLVIKPLVWAVIIAVGIVFITRATRRRDR
jgi:Domain of unknown function (DUF1707)